MIRSTGGWKNGGKVVLCFKCHQYNRHNPLLYLLLKYQQWYYHGGYNIFDMMKLCEEIKEQIPTGAIVNTMMTAGLNIASENQLLCYEVDERAEFIIYMTRYLRIHAEKDEHIYHQLMDEMNDIVSKIINEYYDDLERRREKNAKAKKNPHG